jgi:hypothetical protein
MPRYQSRPVSRLEVMAEQFTGPLSIASDQLLPLLPAGALWQHLDNSGKLYPVVRDGMDLRRLFPGDWVIEYPVNHYYVMSTEWFATHFEPIDKELSMANRPPPMDVTPPGSEPLAPVEPKPLHDPRPHHKHKPKSKPDEPPPRPKHAEEPPGVPVIPITPNHDLPDKPLDDPTIS